MNKSELIRKAAKIAGAPEADASLFFEIFIRSAADILNPGDLVQIKDLGFLHYKIAKADGKEGLRNLKTVFPGSGWVDLIIFSESSGSIPPDPLFFLVPAKYEFDFAEIDAPFTLSFNKPVIQHLQKGEAYFIPQSYGELVRLLESKAARMLVNAKVIKNQNKENEVFNIGAVSPDEQVMTLHEPEPEAYTEEKKIQEPEKELISPAAPEEENNKPEETKVEYSAQKNEEVEEEKIESAPEILEKEDKEEIIPSEVSAESTVKSDQELPEPAFDEIKQEEKSETETGIAQNEMGIPESEMMASGEEIKNEQPDAQTEEAETGIKPDEKEKIDKSPNPEEREIDKLLSKGSFGANIPWKFDEINIIQPGKKEEPGEENEEEYSKDENLEMKEERTSTPIEPAEIGKEETEAETPLDNTGKPTADLSETGHPGIMEENLIAGESQGEKILSGDRIETPGIERPVEEIGKRPESDRAEELTQAESPGEAFGKIESETFGSKEKSPDEIRDFSDTEGMAESGYSEEKNIGEIKEESKETAQEPADDQGYEVIKPVKLKYDWKEGYLKEGEESPDKEKSEKEEEKEPEIPDEEGYIEIKPIASKEKIDFLADNEEEEQTIKDEKLPPAEDQAQKDLKEYISKIEEIDKQSSHKRRTTTILALVVFLLFVSIGVFLYYQYIFKKSTPSPVKKMTVVLKNAKTINRDFEIPVTYPYSKNENKGSLYTQPIDSSIIGVSRTVPAKTTAPLTGGNTQNAAAPQDDAKLESLGDYIFRQGNEYIVQVSSFETQARAETQANSWKKANYNAFVRLDKRPTKTYYCVMIKGFKSYDEAKHFLK